jgi:beta-galactosidase/beta-glucuronidase
VAAAVAVDPEATTPTVEAAAVAGSPTRNRRRFWYVPSVVTAAVAGVTVSRLGRGRAGGILSVAIGVAALVGRAPECAAAIGGTVDLDGPWLTKDFAPGRGLAREVHLPGHVPTDALPIDVPGTVREALRKAGKIPDPYVGYENEKSLWTVHKEWWFWKTFSLGPEARGKHVDLVFEGTSYEGEVWLNGQRVGALKGMLNPRAFEVSPLLVYDKENTIAVRLVAPPDAGSTKQTRGLTFRTPRDQLYSIAQSMYGWDWGPYGVPVGIWRPVKLRVSGPLRIEHPYIRTDDISRAKAHCDVDLDVSNPSSEETPGTLRGAILESGSGKKVAAFEQPIRLGPGESRTVHVDLEVRHPKLWWPNGMGRQDLYLLEVSVSTAAGESERQTTRFGIRELKLVENDKVAEFLKTMKEHVGDSHHLGNVVGSYPWTFQINGKKMFAKGGNWIPADQLLRLGRDRYQRLLGLARDSHFNLLRVWGGGLYETDDFYELCDEYGILAWQEFLSNRNFSKIDRETFLDGADAAILRLRNHPSLTFWCGGNEFDPDDQGSKAVIDSLDALLKRRDPQREFHRASPYMGDDHYWGVWHHKEPYTAYRVVRPFRSEAGLNAPPVLENYLKFTPEALRWPLDETYVEYRGESNPRFAHLDKLRHYADQFGESASLEEVIRKSQLYQALGNEFDMEYCRSNKFRNSGFLVWQYNDIWPAISWATVDWYGTPKPAYYFQKRASRPIHVSADFERYLWEPGETFGADVYLLNDTEARVPDATFVARLLDVTGKTIVERRGAARAGANASAKIGRIEQEIPDEMAHRVFFVAVELNDKQGRKISDALYPIAVGDAKTYAGAFAEMNRMPPVAVQAEIATAAWVLATGENQKGSASGTVRLSNASSQLAFFIRVQMREESETLRTTYSDNYVSLLPGESKTIAVNVELTGPPPEKLHLETSGWNCPPHALDVTLNAHP